MLEKYIIFLTFIPWIFMFIISIIKNLNNDNYLKFSFKYLRKNIFKIFRLDMLFLIVVYFYFSNFDMEFVDKYLFVVMNIYLFVNSFYDQKLDIKKDFFKNNLFNLVLLFLVMVGPFLVYFKTKDLNLVYKIMLLYLYLEYGIIMGVSYLNKLFKKVLKK